MDDRRRDRSDSTVVASAGARPGVHTGLVDSDVTDTNGRIAIPRGSTAEPLTLGVADTGYTQDGFPYHRYR